MAPEIAQTSLNKLGKGSRVIDPLCGSGTVLRAAVENGIACVGTDVDPLAVLMSRVWTTPIQTCRLAHDAGEVIRIAKSIPESELAGFFDSETAKFIGYWFADRQAVALARLASCLPRLEWSTRDALSIALSRIIVSKEMMASLARDTSHSRPHKVAEENDFDVYSGFTRSAREISKRLNPDLIRATALVQTADARSLTNVSDQDFDLALTSPPYLNAIDYLRGHRLALVWLGYNVGTIREIRSASVGAERILSETQGTVEIDKFIVEKSNTRLSDRHRGWVRRYASDMKDILAQLRRVVRTGGKIVLVVGNSFLRGSIVDNAGLTEALARDLHLELVEKAARKIPARRRYLPPPGCGNKGLDSRMRTEVVLSLRVV